jgi:hypothetical protein
LEAKSVTTPTAVTAVGVGGGKTVATRMKIPHLQYGQAVNITCAHKVL